VITLAEIALARNNLTAALQAYADGTALATDRGTIEYGRLLRLEAQVAAAQGETERALHLLAESEALFTHLHNAPEATRSRRLRACLAAANAPIS
jgi:hypothetical protein